MECLGPFPSTQLRTHTAGQVHLPENSKVDFKTHHVVYHPRATQLRQQGLSQLVGVFAGGGGTLILLQDPHSDYWQSLGLLPLLPCLQHLQDNALMSLCHSSGRSLEATQNDSPTMRLPGADGRSRHTGDTYNTGKTSGTLQGVLGCLLSPNVGPYLVSWQSLGLLSLPTWSLTAQTSGV